MKNQHQNRDFVDKYLSLYYNVKKKLLNIFVPGYSEEIMDFLKNNMRFSFLYGDETITEKNFGKEVFENDCSVTTVLTSRDGLTVTNIAKKHEKYGVYEWVNYFENTGNVPTKIISELWDCDIKIPFPHDGYLRDQAKLPDPERVMKIYAPSGSVWADEEFYCNVNRTKNNRFDFYLFPGERRQFAASGGRSSEAHAPFFNVHKNGRGFILAVGWTGQWHSDFGYIGDYMEAKTGLEDTSFRLFPGEKIRTSSAFIMPYEGSVEYSQNKWRRFIKEVISPIGKNGYAEMPLCAMFWGGMPSDEMVRRINRIKEHDIPVDCIWVDAGWYGMSEKESIDEFQGDWGSFTGDWRVNPRIHPDGLHEVAEAAHKTGKKFLLWLEPERVLSHTPISKEHPGYFFGSSARLLNLGNEDAWKYCFEMLSEKAEELSLDCYRQDFNMSPITYWRGRDAEDRRGISEIKHIMGLYRLWDALLEKFPHLLIDNCASGGRRIDIETMRRSVPLWRSDAMCPVDCRSATVQMHNMTYSAWIPHSGASIGPHYDVYSLRSSYASGLAVKHAYTVKESFDDEKKLSWLAEYLKEYLDLRPYFTADFHALTEPSGSDDVWSAVQFDRPEQGDGIVQVFRRERAPYTQAIFTLAGIDENGEYSFTDIDSSEETHISGAELAEHGFCVSIAEKRTAKIYRYRKVK